MLCLPSLAPSCMPSLQTAFHCDFTRALLCLTLLRICANGSTALCQCERHCSFSDMRSVSLRSPVDERTRIQQKTAEFEGSFVCVETNKFMFLFSVVCTGLCGPFLCSLCVCLVAMESPTATRGSNVRVCLCGVPSCVLCEKNRIGIQFFSQHATPVADAQSDEQGAHNDRGERLLFIKVAKRARGKSDDPTTQYVAMTS